MDLETIKQIIFPKKPKNGFSGSSETASIETVPEHHSEYTDNSELQNIKKQNARLKNQVEQLKTKLHNTKDNNAKFIALISHDLRSPFNVIIGTLELLKEDIGSDEQKQNYYIKDVFESAENTLNLIDNLQNWAIIQNNKEYFNPVKINLSGLFEELIESIDFLAKPKQIKLDSFVDPDLRILADPQLIKAILRNLIDNAIKFTDNEGTISLRGLERGKDVEITVKDTGKGISWETQKNLFNNPFHAINGSRNTRNKGRAHLGLFLCKEFVKVHGGTIKVESEPGKGSEFKFTLPYNTNGFSD